MKADEHFNKQLREKGIFLLHFELIGQDLYSKQSQEWLTSVFLSKTIPYAMTDFERSLLGVGKLQKLSLTITTKT